MRKIIEVLKSKWLQNTGRTAILIAIIVVIFLGITLIVRKIDPKDIDLTEEKLYSLTDESKEKIASLPDSDKFEIYMFDFKEDNAVVDLVKQYTRVNKNINLQIIEKTEDRPDLAGYYNVESGYYTIVLVRGDKQKSYTSYDLSTYDYNTGMSIDITEERLTNGLIAISSVRNYNSCVYA